jgi:uncharacterized membrane protein YgaE (UPF0421/DUF939 family)
MPESRNRQKHHHHHQQTAHHAPAKHKRSAAFVLAILAAVFGLAVAYFSQGVDALWMVIGAALGAVIGYLIGYNMDKAIEKDK